MSIKYDANSLGLMSSFEQLTHSKLKDFFEMGETYVFVVEPFQLRKALGERGANVKRLKEKLNKRVKIVEYSLDLESFVKNLIYPLKTSSFSYIDNVITLEGVDTQTKGLLIGRNAQNLRAYEKAVQRYFSEVKEIKIV